MTGESRKGEKMIKITMVFTFLIFAAPAFGLDGNQLLMQIDRNLNPESYEMYRKIVNVEPDGKMKEYTLF